jgi:hypothetical protein
MLLGTKVCARKELLGSVRNETFGEEGIEFTSSLRNGLHARSHIRHRHLESPHERWRENQLDWPLRRVGQADLLNYLNARPGTSSNVGQGKNGSQ